MEGMRDVPASARFKNIMLHRVIKGKERESVYLVFLSDTYYKMGSFAAVSLRCYM